jgi:hypothetical protein
MFVSFWSCRSIQYVYSYCTVDPKIMNGLRIQCSIVKRAFLDLNVTQLANFFLNMDNVCK